MATLDAQNALTARDFHAAIDCAQTVTYGPRGGATFPRTEEWRRNGATQVWKTRPGEFRIPVKYGLRSYGNLTQYESFGWHVGRATECPDGTLAASIAEYTERTIAARDGAS